MQPAVRAPAGVLRGAIDVKLKPEWRFDAARGLFATGSGRSFVPADLPPGARIVHKVPSLAAADPAALTGAERELQRHLQVILPAKRSAAPDLAAIRAWPCVETAASPPEISLP
jgi:hypothetical protein